MAAKMAEAIANGLDAPEASEDGQAEAGGQGLGGQDFEDMLNALQDLTETGASVREITGHLAELVGHALDHDCFVARDRARGCLLVLHVGEEGQAGGLRRRQC